MDCRAREIKSLGSARSLLHSQEIKAANHDRMEHRALARQKINLEYAYLVQRRGRISQPNACAIEQQSDDSVVPCRDDLKVALIVTDQLRVAFSA